MGSEKPPTYPRIVRLSHIEVRGADALNLLAPHLLEPIGRRGEMPDEDLDT